MLPQSTQLTEIRQQRRVLLPPWVGATVQGILKALHPGLVAVEHRGGAGEAVQQLARDKAEWVAQSLAECEEGTLVIGSDTIVVFENRILGKPKDRRDAAETLEKLQGNTHQVYTGVTVLERKAGKWVEHTFFESTDVTFYPVSREEIQDYMATGEPMDKAGSYGIQGLFGIYVKGICGDYNNVVGLPVARLFHEMKKSGINLRG